MKKYAFGADIGGTTIKLGLFESMGNLDEVWEIPARIQDGGKAILPDIVCAIEKKLTEKGISKLDIEGIGLGVPGPVHADGTVLKCVNPGWGVFNVEQEMSGLSGLKVRAGNDANVAALGEAWQGGGKGFRNLLGKALASIACVINPEAFVIGGGMSKAELGNKAGIYGAVRLVLE